MNQYLDRHDVGALLGISGATVTVYRQRYADSPTPFPEPDIQLGQAPGWSSDRAEEIQAWAAGRPGRWSGRWSGRTTTDDDVDAEEAAS